MLVPTQFVNVIEECPGSIRVVGDVGAASGQIPNKPGVDGTEGEFAASRAQPQCRIMVEEPLDLRSGKVSVENETGARAQFLLQALRLEPLAQFGCSPVLPDDGISHRQTGCAIPEDRRLPLVCNADCPHFAGLDSCLSQGASYHFHGDLPDLHRVVLDPTWPGVILSYLCIGPPLDIYFPVENEDSGPGRSLVDG